MTKDPRVYLAHILECIEKVERFTADGRDCFLRDAMIQDAVLRNFEVIGEAAKRPDVGTQAQFKKKKPPVTYCYDSSLSPALDWDGQNSAREQGEAAIEEISRGLTRISADIKAGRVKIEKDSATAQGLAKAREATERLKSLSKPLLNWAGKAERLSFGVPTLPLFVHERLSTKAIIETLNSHKRDKQQTMFELFGDPEHSITDQVLRPLFSCLASFLSSYRRMGESEESPQG
jgi:hypothetical protein